MMTHKYELTVGSKLIWLIKDHQHSIIKTGGKEVIFAHFFHYNNLSCN